MTNANSIVVATNEVINVGSEPFDLRAVQERELMERVRGERRSSSMTLYSLMSGPYFSRPLPSWATTPMPRKSRKRPS